MASCTFAGFMAARAVIMRTRGSDIGFCRKIVEEAIQKDGGLSVGSQNTDSGLRVQWSAMVCWLKSFGKPSLSHSKAAITVL